MIACIILCLIDSYKDKHYEDGHSNQIDPSEDISLSSFSQIQQLGSLFWIITLLCVTLYGAVIPFNYIASGFFTETYFKDLSKTDAQNKAGLYMSIPFFISALVVPVYGIMIDKFGQRAYLACLASFMGLLCFVMFYFVPPFYALIILGLTYSMFASVIWPAISLVVKQHVVVYYSI
jgi:drug/metabolite transporter (DMT)-like permease